MTDPTSFTIHLERCMAQFEDFCVVTESTRNGIPVSVKVVDAAGRTLYDSGVIPAKVA